MPKALTLWEPWATLVSFGYKHFETRSWGTNYRGTLYVHAAKRDPKKEKEFWKSAAGKRAAFLIGDEFISENNWKLGYVIAKCQLTDVVQMTKENIRHFDQTEKMFGIYSPGRFAWKLEKVENILFPIPARGFQRLWKFTEAT